MPQTIDTKMVRHIARLSRIEVSDEKLEGFRGQLAAILEYFDKLQQLETDDVEPMAHAVKVTNVFGEDVVRPGLTPGQALANAPARDGDLFQVPKVIGEG